MKEYMLLFRGGDAHRADAQKNKKAYEAHMQKWGQWMGALQKGGKLISGNPFGPEGAVISGSKKKVTGVASLAAGCPGLHPYRT